MLFHEQPTDPWTRGDFKLIEAYQTLQDETCSDCGNPTWLCHSEDSNLAWSVKTQVCYAAKTLGEHREEASKKNKGKQSPGEQMYVVPFTLKYDEDGNPEEDYENLPTREAFFKEKENDG